MENPLILSLLRTFLSGRRLLPSFPLFLPRGHTCAVCYLYSACVYMHLECVHCTYKTRLLIRREKASVSFCVCLHRQSRDIILCLIDLSHLVMGQQSPLDHRKYFGFVCFLLHLTFNKVLSMSNGKKNKTFAFTVDVLFLLRNKFHHY